MTGVKVEVNRREEGVDAVAEVEDEGDGKVGADVEASDEVKGAEEEVVGRVVEAGDEDDSRGAGAGRWT